MGRIGIDAAGAESLLTSTHRELEEAGRLQDPRGVLLLKLAASIDEGGHSGAGLASLSNAFNRARLVALAQVTGDEDSDESAALEVG